MVSVSTFLDRWVKDGEDVAVMRTDDVSVSTFLDRWVKVGIVKARFDLPDCFSIHFSGSMGESSK